MSARQKILIYPFLFVVVLIMGLTVLEVGRAKVAPSGSNDSIPSDSIPSPSPHVSEVSTQPQTSQPAFSVTTARKVTGRDGMERLVSTTQRFQRSDGLFKLVHTSYTPEGTTSRVQTSFGFIGIGVFRLDEARRRLVFSWPHVDERLENVERFLREHSLFARDETVQGVNTVVWRQAGAVETEFTEEYRAPSLGGLLVKTVKVSRRGRETLEPTSIETGEPAQNVFADFFLYPVDYSSFERRAQEEDGRSASEIASLMREALARMRQVRP